MGRRLRSTLEVTTFDRGRELSLRVVEGPVRLTIRHLLEPSGDGTRLALEAQGEGDPPRFRLAARLAAQAGAREARQDLKRLKRLLETP